MPVSSIPRILLSYTRRMLIQTLSFERETHRICNFRAGTPQFYRIFYQFMCLPLCPPCPLFFPVPFFSLLNFASFWPFICSENSPESICSLIPLIAKTDCSRKKKIMDNSDGPVGIVCMKYTGTSRTYRRL